MAKKKKNKAERHIFRSFYDFNKWLHSKDWISMGIIPYQHNRAMQPMTYGYEVVVPTIK